MINLKMTEMLMLAYLAGLLTFAVIMIINRAVRHGRARRMERAMVIDAGYDQHNFINQINNQDWQPVTIDGHEWYVRRNTGNV